MEDVSDEECVLANELGCEALRIIMSGSGDAIVRMIAVQFLVCNVIINLGVEHRGYEMILQELSSKVKDMFATLALARHEGTLQ